MHPHLYTSIHKPKCSFSITYLLINLYITHKNRLKEDKKIDKHFLFHDASNYHIDKQLKIVIKIIIKKRNIRTKDPFFS